MDKRLERKWVSHDAVAFEDPELLILEPECDSTIPVCLLRARGRRPREIIILKLTPQYIRENLSFPWIRIAFEFFISPFTLTLQVALYDHQNASIRSYYSRRHEAYGDGYYGPWPGRFWCWMGIFGRKLAPQTEVPGSQIHLPQCSIDTYYGCKLLFLRTIASTKLIRHLELWHEHARLV